MSLVNPRRRAGVEGAGPLVNLSVRTPLGAAVALLCLVAWGCESLPSADPPRLVGPDRARESIQVSDDDYAKLGLRREWTGYATVGRGAGVRYVKAYPDALLIQDGAANLSLMETTSGEVRWRNTLTTPLTRFVGLTRVGDRVVSCGEAEAFLVDQTTGQTLDRQRLELVASTPPVTAGSALIFGTGAGRVMSHSTSAGITLWQNATDGSISAPPSVVGGAIGFVSRDGNILFVDAGSGSRVGAGRIGGGTDVATASSNRLMFVASRDQSLYAFSPLDYRPIWRKRTPAALRFAPVHHAGVVYCHIAGQGLTAFDAETGDELWSAPGVEGEVVSIYQERLIAWDGTTATSLEVGSGSVIQSIEMPGVARLASMTLTDPALYAVSDLGLVIRLVPRF